VIALALVFLAITLFSPASKKTVEEKDSLNLAEISNQEFENLTPDDVPEPELEDWQIKQSPECAEREEGVSRDYCYKELSLEEENISYCNSIEDEYTRLDCVSGIASILEDASLCKSLPIDDQRFCFYSVAIYTDNPFVCENISIEANKQGCYKTVLRNIVSQEVCDQLSKLEQLCTEVDEEIKEDCLDRLGECKSEDVI